MALTALREMEMIQLPKPHIKHSDEVLLKVAAVGVCGSDVHYFTRGKIGELLVQYPFLVGHETTAIVEQVGSEVKRVMPGDHVVIDPLIACGTCSQCGLGRHHTCLNARFLGCPSQLAGSLTEYIVMPQQCCFPIKKELSLIDLVLVEPLSVAVYAAQLCADFSSQNIGILGAGPIGLSVLFVLKTQGVRSVYVTDKIEDRLHIARKLGADGVGNSNKADVVRQIQNSETNLLDAIFECCGDQAALDQAIELLKPGGTLFIIGIPEVDRISFDISLMRRKEIKIQNVRRQNNCIPPAIELVENHAEYGNALITHRFPFEKTKQAFEMVADYKDGVVKAVIQLI